MTTRLTCLAMVICFAIASCKAEYSAFPLTVETLRNFTPENTSAISFEERDGDVFVYVGDTHGDRHVHRLALDATPKQVAIDLLRQKQAEIGER